MTICCPVEAVVVLQDKPVVAVAVPTDQPVVGVAVIPKGLPGDQGVNADGNYFRDPFTPTNGQTMFNLTNTVFAPQLSQLYINGQKVDYGAAYTFSGSMTILLWISTEYNLEDTDLVELYYYYT